MSLFLVLLIPTIMGGVILNNERLRYALLTDYWSGISSKITNFNDNNVGR